MRSAGPPAWKTKSTSSLSVDREVVVDFCSFVFDSPPVSTDRTGENFRSRTVLVLDCVVIVDARTRSSTDA